MSRHFVCLLSKFEVTRLNVTLVITKKYPKRTIQEEVLPENHPLYARFTNMYLSKKSHLQLGGSKSSAPTVFQIEPYGARHPYGNTFYM